MRGEVRGVKGEAIGAPFHDVCDDAGREPPRPISAATRLNSPSLYHLPAWKGCAATRSFIILIQALLARYRTLFFHST